MAIKAGDTIKYQSAAGSLTATVNTVKFGPTAKPGHSIPWLNITIHADSLNGRRFASSVNLPADEASLKMFKVEVVNA